MIKIRIAGETGTVPNYVQALRLAGAEPVDSLTPEHLEEFDGLLLPGGPDIDPARYGQENTASVLADATVSGRAPVCPVRCLCQDEKADPWHLSRTPTAACLLRRHFDSGSFLCRTSSCHRPCGSGASHRSSRRFVSWKALRNCIFHQQLPSSGC